ncbi:hypothetical protein M5D96_006203 [Drosophila gunungcola]|uniref:Uncharacterized protein n=1 Tax=Drosophila gunungcola TaxID=103775 RepID=A0A9P9YNI8_9MUSC|nr:hypothetical protein M5D96_006203 [Drosophila gunungcola]
MLYKIEIRPRASAYVIFFFLCGFWVRLQLMMLSPAVLIRTIVINGDSVIVRDLRRFRHIVQYYTRRTIHDVIHGTRHIEPRLLLRSVIYIKSGNNGLMRQMTRR